MTTSPTRRWRSRFVATFIPVAVIFFLFIAVTDGAASHVPPSSQQQDDNTPLPSGTETITNSTTTTTSTVLPPQRKVAVVTLVTTSDYIAGAQVLAESLHRVNATGDRILLWVSSDDDDRSDLTEQHIQDSLLKKSSSSSYRSSNATNDNSNDNNNTNDDVGWDKAIQLTKKDGTFTSCQLSEEQKAEIDASPHLGGLVRYWGTCSKFAVWTLTDYDVVIYLDADSLALNNFDFIFDVFLGQQQHEDNSEVDDARKNILFAAQGNTDCWEAPPYNVCENFYTAIMALRPSEPIAKYLHDVAQSKGVHLMHGELVLLNSIIKNWYHLPRYTLVAQSEKARPTVGNDPSNGNIMDAAVDWSQVKVYDFAGPPATKPWRNYWLQKKTGDKYAHEYLGRLTPGMEAFRIGMYPQWVWNEYYDAVLKRAESYNQQASNKDEL